MFYPLQQALVGFAGGVVTAMYRTGAAQGPPPQPSPGQGTARQGTAGQGTAGQGTAGQGAPKIP